MSKLASNYFSICSDINWEHQVSCVCSLVFSSSELTLESIADMVSVTLANIRLSVLLALCCTNTVSPFLTGPEIMVAHRNTVSLPQKTMSRLTTTLSSQVLPKPHSRLDSRLLSTLSELESSLGPMLPVVTTLILSVAGYVAFNFEYWMVTSSGLVEGKEVEVRDAGAKGLGAFLTKPVRKGTIVGQYKGVVTGVGELATRYKPKDGTISDNAYLFELREQSVYIDANPGDVPDELVNWTRRINHSSKPNLEIESNVMRELVWFIATRDIQVGEELCFNYGEKYWAGFEEDSDGNMVPIKGGAFDKESECIDSNH